MPKISALRVLGLFKLRQAVFDLQPQPGGRPTAARRQQRQRSVGYRTLPEVAAGRALRYSKTSIAPKD
jgi:hypothetical protein